MATLTVSHYLYLSKKERYSLNDGNTVEVIGICIPVWFSKGTTTEPAKEVFCKYKLNNTRETKVNIKMLDEGFELDMPYFDEEDQMHTSEFTKDEKQFIVKKIGTSESLLDLKDDGFEKAEFKLYQKLLAGNELHHLIHYIDIKPIELLLDTIN